MLIKEKIFYCTSYRKIRNYDAQGEQNFNTEISGKQIHNCYGLAAIGQEGFTLRKFSCEMGDFMMSPSYTLAPGSGQIWVIAILLFHIS